MLQIVPLNKNLILQLNDLNLESRVATVYWQHKFPFSVRLEQEGWFLSQNWSGIQQSVTKVEHGQQLLTELIAMVRAQHPTVSDISERAKHNDSVLNLLNFSGGQFIDTVVTLLQEECQAIVAVHTQRSRPDDTGMKERLSQMEIVSKAAREFNMYAMQFNNSIDNLTRKDLNNLCTLLAKVTHEVKTAQRQSPFCVGNLDFDALDKIYRLLVHVIQTKGTVLLTHDEITTLMVRLIKNGFVITTQPRMICKMGSEKKMEFPLVVRLLGACDYMRHYGGLTIRAKVLKGDDCVQWYGSTDYYGFENMHSYCKINKNNVVMSQMYLHNNQVTAEFPALTLSACAVGHKRVVSEDLSAIAVYTQFRYLDHYITLKDLSHPIVLTTNSNQESECIGSLLWHRSFAPYKTTNTEDISYCDFNMEDEVQMPMKTYKTTIIQLCSMMALYLEKIGGRKLTEREKLYLQSRIYIAAGSKSVKDILYDRYKSYKEPGGVTLWQWFYGVLQTITLFNTYWRNGFLFLINKRDAVQKILDPKFPRGTFLLRFRETEITEGVPGFAPLSVVAKAWDENGQDNVIHVKDFLRIKEVFTKSPGLEKVVLGLQATLSPTDARTRRVCSKILDWKDIVRPAATVLANPQDIEPFDGYTAVKKNVELWQSEVSTPSVSASMSRDSSAPSSNLPSPDEPPEQDPTPTVLDMQKGGAAAIVPADYNGDPVSYATLNYGSTAEALSEGMEVLNTPPEFNLLANFSPTK